MAIEYRALFALSIAFTASIVAYPVLPPEIPPLWRVRGEWVFIGAPFVAFLLPITAAVIWWLLRCLSRHPAETARRSGGAGPVTALFLSAFHVTKGMRQRVLLAAALLHNPDLLVLDEPFSGLDVTAGLLFRTLLRLFAAGDRMVLFSTHRFDIVEQLCSRVMILSGGHIAAEHEVASFRDARSLSLEEEFVRVTRQADFAPVARQILDVMQLV